MSQTETVRSDTEHAHRMNLLAELFAEAYNFDGSGCGEYVSMLYDLTDEAGISRELTNTAKQAGFTRSEL